MSANSTLNQDRFPKGVKRYLWVAVCLAIASSSGETRQIAVGGLIRGSDVVTLRTRIDAQRARVGLSVFAWADPTISVGVTVIRAQHVIDLRRALLEAYSAAKVTAPTLGTDPASGDLVRAAIFKEIESAAEALENASVLLKGHLSIGMTTDVTIPIAAGDLDGTVVGALVDPATSHFLGAVYQRGDFHAAVYARDDGLPDRVVVNDVVFVFRNYIAETVDIAAVTQDGKGYALSVSTEAAAASTSLVNKSAIGIKPAPEEEPSTLKDFMEVMGGYLGGSLCAISAAETRLAPSLLPVNWELLKAACGSSVLQILDSAATTPALEAEAAKSANVASLVPVLSAGCTKVNILDCGSAIVSVTTNRTGIVEERNAESTAAARHELGNTRVFVGPLAGSVELNFTGGGDCTRVEALTGTLRVRLLSPSTDKASGNASIDAPSTVTSTNCQNGPRVGDKDSYGFSDTSVTESSNTLSFTSKRSNTFGEGTSAGTNTVSWTFNGSVTETSLTETSIVGTLRLERSIETFAASDSGTGSSQFTVTLREMSCDEDRAALREEYTKLSFPSTPSCDDFTKDVPTSSPYNFPAWMISQRDDPRGGVHGWAILREVMVANTSCIVSTYKSRHGETLVLTSGYRSPKIQKAKSPGAKNARHSYGDAADFDTPHFPDDTMWNELRTIAKSGDCGVACVEPRKDISEDHFHVDYRPGGCPNSKW